MTSTAKQTVSVVATSRDWRRVYATRLIFTDVLVLTWVVFGVQLAWVGLDTGALGFSGSSGNIDIEYTVVSVVIIFGWLAALAGFGSREYRVLGVGSAEYKLIANATGSLFGSVAIVAFLFKVDLARGYVLIAFPVGLLVLVASRWMWRQWLAVQRLNGRFSSTVLLVGSGESVSHIARELRRQPAAGYRVVGACVPSGTPASSVDETIPVVGNVKSVTAALATTGADTVIITSADELPPARVRELSWSLEPGRQHLVVAPSLTDLGGPRIHARPVAGLPLIHVETPRYEGSRNTAKRFFDVVVSAVALTFLAPLLVVVAVMVKVSSPGPVLFKQARVGLGGSVFPMLKFRSMVTDAEALLEDLQEDERRAGNAVMFKMKNDPRVTPIGKLLRRFSLDELPQLFNVLGGSMSLVGPRPPLESEVSGYDKHVHRRFLVKPGITGLWQVSGRSNLSWEDTVRLDLFYVENWSMTGDLIILGKTLRAVLGREGAY